MKKPAKRLMHLETKVQHELLLVDENGRPIRKIIGSVIVVSPEEWPDYSNIAFPAAIAEDERLLNEEVTEESAHVEAQQTPGQGE